MAVAIRNCLGVDIGSQSIRVADLELGKAGPRVISLLEERIKMEPGLSEEKRQLSIARQVQDLLKKGKVRTKNAVFCVPGQSVFVRRIKLPKTTPERMSRIIRFEAKQQIPFPLDKTIMEYQVFEEGEGNEVNVLLVAIKRDFIDNFMKLVRRTGLRPLAISVSSLALYNFHELNNSTRDLLGHEVKKTAAGKDTSKAKKGKKNEAQPAADESVAVLDDEFENDGASGEMAFEEIPAFVNLGAALVDLAIPKPGPARMIGFTRSVPLAGNEMDRLIQQKLNLADMSQAQALKEREAAVMSTEFEVEADQSRLNTGACEVVTAVADRLISELRRSLDFYISQPDGVAVDTIVLSGGLAKLRYLSGYIEEKLGLPVQLAEARHTQLRLSEPAPEPFCPYAVAMGLALQGLQLAQNKINFLPDDIKNVRSLQDRRWEAVAAVAMVLVIVGLNFNVGASYTANYKTKAEEMNQIILQASKGSSEIDAAEARNKRVAEAYEKLAKATGMRDYWFMFLRVFLEQRSPEVLIDSIEMRADGNVIVRGKTINRNAVAQMIDGLKTLKGGIWEAAINSIDAQPKHDPRFSASGNDQVFDYTMTVTTLVRQARIRNVGDQPEVVRGGNAGNANQGFNPYQQMQQPQAQPQN